MATISVRYIVNDVNAAIAFYTSHLGFAEVMHPAPAFAMLSRGDLHRGEAAHRRCPVPQRHRHGHGWQADPRRGPVRQPRRTVRADPARSQARIARRPGLVAWTATLGTWNGHT